MSMFLIHIIRLQLLNKLYLVYLKLWLYFVDTTFFIADFLSENRNDCLRIFSFGRYVNLQRKGQYLIVSFCLTLFQSS